MFNLPADWADGRELKVLLIGLGGTGSEMLDALLRLDYVLREIGRPAGLSLHLQDGDKVSPSNVGRQRFLHADVGRNKAQVLAERYGMLHNLTIRYSASFAQMRHLNEFSDFHLIITAVDRAAFRVKIGEKWRGKSCSTLWLDCGNGAKTGQVVLGHLGVPKQGLRLPNVYDLFPDLKTTRDDDAPSCSLVQSLAQQRLGINRFMADAAVFTLLTPLLTEGRLKVHGAYVDAMRPSVTPLDISPLAWKFHGFDPDAPLVPTARQARRVRAAPAEAA